MLITTAIRTLNRAESLRRTLGSLVAMQTSEGAGWEVVVVNNNCSDHTDAVIAFFENRLPIRREFEALRGQSHARNRAIDIAQGDYITWLDDDMVVAPGWLASYAEAFLRWPEAAVFGGPIIPRYTLPVPDWILQSDGALDQVFSARNFGSEPLPLSPAGDRLPYGNFAMRIAEARAFRADPDLGVRPGVRLLGEDTDVIVRVLGSGATGFWVPGASVEHCIRSDMQTKKFVVRRFAANGETHAFLARRQGRWLGSPFLLGVPRWIWRQLIEGWLRYQIHRVMSPARVWVRDLANYGFARGAIHYLLTHKA